MAETPTLTVPTITPEVAETLATARRVAAAADRELQRGVTLGPAVITHLADGLGNPAASLMVLGLLEQLLAAAPANQEVVDAVSEMTNNTVAFANKVRDFINEAPACLTVAHNCGINSRAALRWRGEFKARARLAAALGWTVPEEPGELAPAIPEVHHG